MLLLMCQGGVTMSRDPGRRPMQWTTGRHAGFTESDKPWLPVQTDYKNVNVEVMYSGLHVLSVTEI